MKRTYICDWCGKDFERLESYMKGKKHVFCSKQCLADFSNKTKNPVRYAELKDFANISATFSRVNRVTNKTRMTAEVKEKLRTANISPGNGKTYAKLYGRPEHRVVAEQILGRPLISGETVHHIDGNKRNNDPSNIRVFKSQREHARFHAELNWFIKELQKIESKGGEAQ